MRRIALVLLAFYAPGFMFFLALNLAIGPVTPALAVVRALVWPVFWATGWPHGSPLRMD